MRKLELTKQNKSENRKARKGFTLVELIIAVAIISVVLVPLARSFINASSSNGSAKRKHNATVVAQNIMEQYKFADLEQIASADWHNLNALDDVDCVSLMPDGRVDSDGDGMFDTFSMYAVEKDSEGNYILDEDGYGYITGASREKFYVEVKIDPSAYTTTDAGKVLINDYNLPEMKDLYNGSNIVIADDYIRYDSYATTKLGTSRANIVKEATIETITRLVKTNVYYSEIYLNVKYTNKLNGATYSNSKYIGSREYATTNNHPPEVYVIFKPYDSTYYNTELPDKINIVHKFETNAASANQVLKVYLIDGQGKDTSYVMGRYNVTLGAICNDSALVAMDVIELYTNLKYIDDKGERANVLNAYDLTYGTEKKDALYGITVIVREDSPTGEKLAEFTSAKEAKYE